MKKIIYHISFSSLLFMALGPGARAQDSAKVLKNVTIKGVKKKNPFTSLLPSQSLGQNMLQQLNVPTVGDAARYFSGVQVKDYGGVGGLRTVSVRSLGAFHTGVFYDGLPVSDVQAGQIDLSRYSSSFLQSIDLHQAHPASMLAPARAYGYAAVLTMHTPWAGSTPAADQWQAGLRAGAFGFWQGFGGASISLPRNASVGVMVDAMRSDGDYPFTIENGNASEKAKRVNGGLRSIQGEVNLSKQFNDSSSLQVKGFTYQSKRGLPGAITFFNTRSVEELYNRDYVGQLRYVKHLATATRVAVAGKYSHAYTRYVDPDFLNNAGGLDDRYRQQEAYVSVAAHQDLGNNLSASLAADAAYSTLRANKNNFTAPDRLGVWSNALVGYADSLWQVQVSLLWSHISDETKQKPDKVNEDKFTPTIAISRRLHRNSPWLARFFYKEVFRMPTFNDLYYNFLSNTNLRPELARQYNAGVAYSKRLDRLVQFLSLSVDGYINRVHDKIIAVPTQNLFSWTMLNLGKVDIKGVDVTVDIQGKLSQQLSWTGHVAYTYQQALDITDPASSKYKDRIPYTPDHSGSGLVSLAYRQWGLGYSVVFSGTRYTLGENNPFNQVDGWGIHDVFVSRQVNLPKIFCTLRLEVNNVADEGYDVIRYYPMPGRAFRISLLFQHKAM